MDNNYALWARERTEGADMETVNRAATPTGKTILSEMRAISKEDKG